MCKDTTDYQLNYVQVFPEFFFSLYLLASTGTEPQISQYAPCKIFSCSPFVIILLNNLPEALMLSAFIRAVPGSKIGWDTECSDWEFSQLYWFIQAYAGIEL